MGRREISGNKLGTERRGWHIEIRTCLGNYRLIVPVFFGKPHVQLMQS